MIEQGKKMGITTWENPKNYGLSLTLGGGAIKMIDLAKVYGTIANYGKRPEITSILQIKDYKGLVLENKNSNITTPLEQILDPRVSYSLIDILKDNNARAPEFGFNSSLVVKNHPEVAVKTGTSNDLRDNWTAGFNQDYLVITWVGNNNNSPMSRVASGITGASPIWNKIMSTILYGRPSIDWEIPKDIVRINCLGRGEWFLKEKIPTDYCKPTPVPTPKSNEPINKILDNGASTVRQ
jgi:membrane carboxypeptidase/penicillin-binding protein PbpC